MFTVNCPPYKIAKRGKNFTVFEVIQGYRFHTNKLQSFCTLEEAEDYIKKLINKDDSWFSFYKEHGYTGSQEDFIKFCTQVTVIGNYDEDNEKDDRQEKRNRKLSLAILILAIITIGYLFRLIIMH